MNPLPLPSVHAACQRFNTSPQTPTFIRSIFYAHLKFVLAGRRNGNTVIPVPGMLRALLFFVESDVCFLFYILTRIYVFAFCYLLLFLFCFFCFASSSFLGFCLLSIVSFLLPWCQQQWWSANACFLFLPLFYYKKTEQHFRLIESEVSD